MEGRSAILVVEDDELVQAFLCHALADVADTVDACADGRSALAAVAHRCYGLILLDGLLPDIHGMELGKRLITNSSTRTTALCVVSGSLRYARSAHDGIAALPKPLRVRDLVATAEELLAWSRAASTGRMIDGAAFVANREASLAAVAADLLVR